jgi:hypothetical protein
MRLEACHRPPHRDEFVARADAHDVGREELVDAAETQ